MRDDLCVGVRDRRTGNWNEVHPAVGNKLEGAIRHPGNGGIVPHEGPPEIGDSVYFRQGANDLITSRLERIDRPPRDALSHYRKE
jgi:hypothetical protein